jgi:hypothetical protein
MVIAASSKKSTEDGYQQTFNLLHWLLKDMNFMVCKLGTGTAGLIIVPALSGQGAIFTKGTTLATNSPSLGNLVTTSMKYSSATAEWS